MSTPGSEAFWSPSPVIADSTASISCLLNVRLGTLALLGRTGRSGGGRSGCEGAGRGSGGGGGGGGGGSGVVVAELGAFGYGGFKFKPLVRRKPSDGTEAERVAGMSAAEVMNSLGSCTWFSFRDEQFSSAVRLTCWG